ncbi:LOW QUALITY PROTEIN: hypothetical protein CVT26_014106, partial [Gymnopilus dilepis]
TTKKENKNNRRNLCVAECLEAAAKQETRSHLQPAFASRGGYGRGSSSRQPHPRYPRLTHLADEEHGTSAVIATPQASTLNSHIARGRHCSEVDSRGATAPAITPARPYERTRSRGAARCNPHSMQSLSQLGDKLRGGGSGYSSGDDGHWAPGGRVATSGSLFDAREVGSALARERQPGLGPTSCLSSRAKMGREGGGGLGLGRRGEITHLRLALLCKGDGMRGC